MPPRLFKGFKMNKEIEFWYKQIAPNDKDYIIENYGADIFKKYKADIEAGIITEAVVDFYVDRVTIWLCKNDYKVAERDYK